jgi:shikimate dehydrogenase
MYHADWRLAEAADYGVIGDPVAHSWSPRMHAAAFRELGLPCSYRAVRVPGAEFDEALAHLAGLGYVGLNATVPLKAAALSWAEVSDQEAIGASGANTLRLADRSATSTDGPGFLDTLAELEVETGTALVVGAGGSARAVVHALTRAGWDVRVHNRTGERAIEVAAAFAVEAIAEPDPGGASLIVNCTAAGLHGQAPEVMWNRAGNALAYDLYYSAQPTPFLADAAEAGLRTVDGRWLLVAQGARSLKWWLGVEAPRKAMLEAIS